MKAIGIDIGTTTICGVVVDVETKELLTAKTLQNVSKLSSDDAYERIQDAEKILDICNKLLNEFLNEYKDVKSIGVTGQMHGILYLDKNGDAVSPLYTWQDQRGNLTYKKECMTYAEYLSKKSDMTMSSGFGLTTHFYNQENGLVPDDAVVFCTIPDFIVMKLSGNMTPKLHQSMAASLGLYDLENHDFDREIVKRSGIDISFLPEVLSEEKAIGHTKEGILLSPALGDNQASFLGAVSSDSNLLVNVGTGSQISSRCDKVDKNVKAEYRPYIYNSYLVTGSPLCGGYAYALMKQFLERTLYLCCKDSSDHNVFFNEMRTSVYDVMNRAARSVYKDGKEIVFDTRFNGTRENAEITGSISNITEATFSPEYFILGTLQGICNELYDYYSHFPESARTSLVMTGSGNGIRLNPLLQEIFEEKFGMKLVIPAYSEEAAYGTAIFSMGIYV